MTRKLPNPRRPYGCPAPFDCSPIRVPGMKDAGKPFEPKAGTVGSEVTFSHAGREIVGQVWCLAVGGVWAVADGVAYLVAKSGYVAETYGAASRVA